MKGRQRSACVWHNQTYVEYLKNPVEVSFPTGNRTFVIHNVKCSRDNASFTQLGNLPLNFDHSSAIEQSVSVPLSVHVVR